MSLSMRSDCNDGVITDRRGKACVRRRRSIGRRSVSVLLGACLLGGWCNLGAWPTYLLSDINSGASSSLQNRAFTVIGGQVLFWASDPVNLMQPWVTDGTPASTHLVGVFLGATGLAPLVGRELSVGDRCIFVANDGSSGAEMWGSNGTLGGTQRLADQTPGSGSTDLRSIKRFGALALYSAEVGGQRRLWKSDGTPLGTAQALPNTTLTGDEGASEFNGTFLFHCGRTSPFISTGLCTTNLTEAGTSALTPSQGLINYLVAVNDRVLFNKSDTTSGNELWRTDGTAGGTALMSDIVPGSGDSSPKFLTRVDDRVFFVATTTAEGDELWVSDGMVGGAGTSRVKDIRTGVSGSAIQEPMVALDGILYFVANDGSTGPELWRSDGTEPGTALVKDTVLGSIGGLGSTRLAVVGKRLYFAANNKLWTSDGTGPGTVIVDNGPTLTSPYLLAPVNGKLVFAANETGQGAEPHALDLMKYRGPVWCSKPERSIPDNSPGGVSDVIHLPSFASVQDLNISVDLGHTWVGDLKVTLAHDDTATMQLLLDRPGGTGTGVGCGADLLDIVLDDQAPTAAETSCLPGNARLAYPRDSAYQPNNPLSVFNGQPLGGTWTLTVSDVNADDVGTLHEWCIVATSDRIYADGFE